jgi:hypothetical protein
MAYTNFPAYALVLLDGFEQRAGGNVQRSDMEDGYTHQAPAHSLTRYELPLTYRLPTTALKDNFEAWRRGNGNGALFFRWPHPVDPTGATTYRARIVGGEVVYKPLTRRLDDWQVSFTLEYWA